MAKRFIVTAMDRSDMENGLPDFKAEFRTREEAEEYVREDMRTYCDNYTYVGDDGITRGPSVYDEDAMYIESANGETSCKWQITEA